VIPDRKSMFNNTRTSAEFHSDKAKGEASERLFIDLIGVMGGAAAATGTIPGLIGQTPKFCRPQPAAEEGFSYTVSPDIFFTLPNMPRGFASFAQVKLKKLQKVPSKGELFVWLDEKELNRMNVASKWFDVFFVIHVPELAAVEGFTEWLWVNVDDLKETHTTLIKRTVCEKPTFKLPLSLFQPLSEITKRSLNEPTNTNAKPKS